MPVYPAHFARSMHTEREAAEGNKNEEYQMAELFSSQISPETLATMMPGMTLAQV
jgi:hypothetical protein